jgi:putative hemolysin
MSLYLTIGGVVVASLLSLFFSSLTYAMREFSRPKLAEYLGRHDADRWFETITEHASDLLFISAVGRQFSNIMMFVLVFGAFEQTSLNAVVRYGMTVVLSAIIAVFCSIAVPQAAAKYAGAEIVGFFAPVLALLRAIFSPITKLMHGTDDVMRRALGAHNGPQQGHIAEEIMNAVEEGEKEGVVDEQEREMIESVIEFGDTTTGQIMTTRPDIAALNVNANLEEAKNIIDGSGHSRIPVFEGTPDHVVGILHARDLIKHVGRGDLQFNLRELMRPATFVPETKLLRDLLSDFRAVKVHIAVVLDEYGSTAGIVTIEDVLEELVGEISDEHEPHEPALFKRIDDYAADADARISIDQLNRLLGLSLPDDAGYETLAGYLTTALSKIPEKGAVYEHDGVRYLVTDAEPHRVKRVRIELLTHPAPVRSAAG